MRYNLPKDKKSLAADKETMAKVNKLEPKTRSVWDDIFLNSYATSIIQYEWILSEINAGRITTDINSQKMAFESQIPRIENELLKMLNEPVNVTDLEKALEKAKALSGQGNVAIRPPIGKSLPQKKEKKKK
jgi:hypothetical protein